MKKRMHSDCANGNVTVTVTPTHRTDRYGKPAYKLRVAKRGMKPWAPKDPLYSSARRRGALFDDAVSFFDYYRCGELTRELVSPSARLGGRACRTRRRK